MRIESPASGLSTKLVELMLMVNQKFILRRGNFSAATERRGPPGAAVRHHGAAVWRGRRARTAPLSPARWRAGRGRWRGLGGDPGAAPARLRLFQEGFDTRRRQNVVDHQAARTKDSGLVGGHRLDNAQPGRGKRQGTLVHHFADAGQEVLSAEPAPPMTITEGLSRLTHVASTSPTSRPAWRMAWTAWMLPWRASWTTSSPVAAGTPSAVSAAATAGPEASASRHP